MCVDSSRKAPLVSRAEGAMNSPCAINRTCRTCDGATHARSPRVGGALNSLCAKNRTCAITRTWCSCDGATHPRRRAGGAVNSPCAMNRNQAGGKPSSFRASLVSTCQRYLSKPAQRGSMLKRDFFQRKEMKTCRGYLIKTCKIICETNSLDSFYSKFTVNVGGPYAFRYGNDGQIEYLDVED